MVSSPKNGNCSFNQCCMQQQLPFLQQPRQRGLSLVHRVRIEPRLLELAVDVAGEDERTEVRACGPLAQAGEAFMGHEVRR